MPLHEDPLLRRWALDVIDDTLFFSAEQRQAVSDAVFPDGVLPELLERSGEDELASLFQMPAERWERLIGDLIGRWPGWRGRAARFAAPLIARYRPAEAAKLFMAFVDMVADGGEPDSERLLGVVGALRHLDRDQAHTLLTKALSLVGEGKRIEFAAWQMSNFAEMALHTVHPDRLDIVRRWLERMAGDGDDRLQGAVVELGEWLFGDASQTGFVRDHALGYTRQPAAPLGGLVFRPLISLVEVDNALRGLPLGDGRTAGRLLRHQLYNPPFDDAPDRWEDFVALVRGGIPHAAGRPAKHVWTEVFGLGGILTLLRQPGLDLASADPEAVWPLVAADIDLPPGLETALPALRNVPRAELVERLSAIARNGGNDLSGGHAATLMGLLGYEEFLPVLVTGLDWEFEDAQTAAVSALVEFGDRAVAALDDHFDQLEGYGQLMVLAVASRVGGDAAAALIAERFGGFVDADAHSLALVATVLDEEPLNAALADWLDEEIPYLTWAHVVLAKRHGRADDPDILDLVATVERWEAEQAEKRIAATRGEIGVDTPTLTLALACRSCGHTTDYAVEEIWILDPAEPDPFLAQDVACSQCGAVSDFDFTPEALAVIGKEAERTGDGVLGRLPGLNWLRDRWSVVKIRPFQGLAGLERSAAGMVRDIEAALAADPVDAAVQRSAGYIYLDTNRHVAAQECFRRCLELDPAYPDAYYGLAQLAQRRNDRAGAITHLLDGAKYGGALACRQPEDWATPADFVADYIELYHEVAGNDPGHPKLPPSLFKTKLGRNDPCPLGTGKKAKKCCGGGH